MSGDVLGVAVRFFAALEHPGTGQGGRSRPEVLCAACVAVLPVRGAAIMIWTGLVWEMLGASDAQTQEYAQTQSAASEGPGPQAHLLDAPVLVPDLGAALAAGQWPLLAAAALTEQGGSVFAFPLHLGAIRIGTLDLYTGTPTTLDRAGYMAAAQVAELVTAILLSATGFGSPGTPQNTESGTGFDDGLGSWWEPAPATREIHQATGIVAVQLATDIATAYARLVAHAVGAGHSLGVIAAEVIARRLRFRPDIQP